MGDLMYNLAYLGSTAIYVAAVFWASLRLMDVALGVKFKNDVFPLINSSPNAAAVYSAGRLIALAILFAPLLRVLL